MSRARSILNIAGLVITMVLAGLTVAYAATGTIPIVDSHNTAARANLTAAIGSLQITDSAGTSALLDASNMAPGEQRAGIVTITNGGTVAGDFTLTASNINDSDPLLPFSKIALLTVSDITNPGSPSTLYSGTPAAMPALVLGTFAAGEAHTYRFVVAFPNGTPVQDNPLQGEVSTVDYTWNATAPDNGGGSNPGGGGSTTPTTPAPPPVGGASNGGGVGGTAGSGGSTGGGSGPSSKITITRAKGKPNPHKWHVTLWARPKLRVRAGRVNYIVSCGRYCVVHFTSTITIPAIHAHLHLRRISFVIRAGTAMRIEIRLTPKVKAALVRAMRHGKRPSITAFVVAHSGRLGARPHRRVLFTR